MEKHGAARVRNHQLIKSFFRAIADIRLHQSIYWSFGAILAVPAAQANLASNQVIVYLNSGNAPGPGKVAAPVSGPTAVDIHGLQPHVDALAAALPDAKLVGVGVPDDEDSVVALLEAGAAGYVTAEQPLGELVTAVEAVILGELRCPPRMSAALARRMAALAANGKRETGGDALTPRQREIATLMAHGLSNKQIAAARGISLRAVKRLRRAGMA